MKIGLLGGSFNPPHNGHIHISNIALKSCRLNQIWWVPTLQNPLKDKNIYDSYENRTHKCEEITKNHYKIRIKKYDEIRTDFLIQKLQKKYKNTQFYWIMGADNLVNFHKWHNFKSLSTFVNFIIVSRETFLSQAKKTKCWKFFIKENTKIIYAKKKNISSTKIRESLKK
jgi:nicotinate-nucleotide adenylyltransferase